MRNFIIISLTIFNLQSRHKYMVEIAMFIGHLRPITPEVDKPELQFMCSASLLIVLYICVKFHENKERTQVHSRNRYFQYLLCSMSCNSKSRLTRDMVFVFSAHCLVVLYIYEKFHNDILNGFQLTEWTQVHGRNGYVQSSKGNNSPNNKINIANLLC